jgi:HEAT repeat protein
MRGDSSRLETFMPYLLHPYEEATGTNAELEMGLAGLDKSETLVPTFAKLMQSTNERIREAAIQQIKDSDSPEALAGLDAALHDEDFQVRLSAVFGVCNRTRACIGQNPTRMARTENIHVVAEIFYTWMAERHHD